VNTAIPSSPLAAAIDAYLESLSASGYAVATVTARRVHLARFTQWGAPRGLLSLADLTPGVLEAFRAQLAAHRTHAGQPLAWSTHAQHLSALKLLCAWATKHEAPRGEPRRRTHAASRAEATATRRLVGSPRSSACSRSPT
jgi:site-specific recombinase XerD